MDGEDEDLSSPAAFSVCSYIDYPATSLTGGEPSGLLWNSWLARGLSSPHSDPSCWGSSFFPHRLVPNAANSVEEGMGVGLTRMGCWTDELNLAQG